ncbi:MAG: fatty acid oxidation complex subunit alpha FadB [Neptuniibacter sp.]
MYQGKTISVKRIGEELVELNFDQVGSSVNVLNELTLNELSEAIILLETSKRIKGLLICSAKEDFILGADITEFSDKFSLPEEELKVWVNKTHEVFNRLENLPYPTVALINGMALGGGFELALAADFRIGSRKCKVGLPEINLGICPGWGGTVRLSRMISPKLALQWILTGKPQNAESALNAGALELVVSSEVLRDEAISFLNDVIAADTMYLKKRNIKCCEKSGWNTDSAVVQQLKKEFSKKLDPNYPAASAILELVCAHLELPANEALFLEIDTLISLAKSDAASSLTGLFINDQILKKKTKSYSVKASPVGKAAVLGAGIMGGGVAYQSASTGTPIVMKDIQEEALRLGVKTASALLDGEIKKGRMDNLGKAVIMDDITPSLNYSEFSGVTMVVEAVVENPTIKKSVLAEVEEKVTEDTILASNTSTISIDTLATELSRPELFCGMHFFNPVHLMPLVEVVRGSKTSELAIANTVAFAVTMGKTPIVVNDCPGFLVNRILFPYFNAFNRLLQDGIDFRRIDRVMETFGWPMGPAYLADVVGIDTLVHADKVMQEGFADRMGHDGDVIAEALHEAGFLGQKSGQGFYEYGTDVSGRRYKEPSRFALELCASDSAIEINDQEIIGRMMIPMCLEAVRCLEEGVVETPAEVDMGLILGLGFPRFRGGALRYIDTVGLDVFIANAKSNQEHGALYSVPVSLSDRAKANRTFF